MFCKKCGTEIAEDSLFCGKCGTPIKKQIDETTRNVEEPSLKKNSKALPKLIIVIGVTVILAIVFLVVLLWMKNSDAETSVIDEEKAESQIEMPETQVENKEEINTDEAESVTEPDNFTCEVEMEDDTETNTETNTKQDSETQGEEVDVEEEFSVDVYKLVLADYAEEWTANADEEEGLIYQYFYYDINQDGCEELILKRETYFAENKLYIYSFLDGDVKKILEIGDGVVSENLCAITNGGVCISGMTMAGDERWYDFYSLQQESMKRTDRFLVAEYWQDEYTFVSEYEIVKGDTLKNSVDKETFDSQFNDFWNANVVYDVDNSIWTELLVDDFIEQDEGIVEETVDNSGWSKAYYDKICEYEKEHADDTFTERKYNLIYLDDDDIPELVIDHCDYWINLYTYQNSGVQDIFEQWGYGTFGRFFEYSNENGVIRDNSYEEAGMICYEAYYNWTKNGELNNEYWVQLNNYDNLSIVYNDGTNGTQNISLEEYNELPYSQLEFNVLIGQYSAEELKELLGEFNETSTIEQESERIVEEQGHCRLYDIVLNDYVNMLVAYSDSEMEGLKYSYFYYDINQDGCEELIVKRSEAGGWDTIYIYSYIDDYPVTIFEREDVTAYEDFCAITKDGICISGTTTSAWEHWTYFYSMESDSMELVDSFYMEEYWYDDLTFESTYLVTRGESQEYLEDRNAYDTCLNNYWNENVVYDLSSDSPVWVELQVDDFIEQPEDGCTVHDYDCDTGICSLCNQHFTDVWNVSDSADNSGFSISIVENPELKSYSNTTVDIYFYYDLTSCSYDGSLGKYYDIDRGMVYIDECLVSAIAYDSAGNELEKERTYTAKFASEVGSYDTLLRLSKENFNKVSRIEFEIGITAIYE